MYKYTWMGRLAYSLTDSQRIGVYRDLVKCW